MMKKRNVMMSLLAGFSFLSAGVSAEPIVYRDGTMLISSGVQITDKKQKYYKDIVLQTDENGKLSVVSLSPRPLAMIDTVMTQTDGESVEVLISGNKSVPCVDLEEVAVSRKDNVFTLLVAETVMGPAESCIAVLDPFDISVALDIKDLPAGSYTVYVNGVESGFDLDPFGALLP